MNASFRSVDSRHLALAIAALILLTAAAFFPVARAEFLNLDDPAYVTANPHVVQGLTRQGLLWALTSFDAANWHPLTWVSHMADVSLFGLSPGAQHLVNLSLHALAAALMLLALQRVTGALWPCLLAASLFAVHPLRVESVAWISERKDVLSVLFGMSTLFAYVRYVRSPGLRRYLAVAGLLALGLMAKPTLVTLPFALGILDWWPLGRLGGATASGGKSRSSRRRVLLEKIPLLALCAASAALTWLAQRQGRAMISGDVFPAAARIGNAILAYVAYLGKLVWPRDLIPFYPHTGATFSGWTVGAWLVLLAGMTGGAWAVNRRRPWLIAGWLWYLGTLVPMLGLIQVGLQGMADRYSYLPSVGICFAVAVEAWERVRRRLHGPKLLGAGAAAALIVLSLLTWRQSGFWKDSATLLRRTIAVDSRNYFAYNMLGADFLMRNEAAQALPLLARALELRPEYFVARYNYALALAGTGRGQEAITQFTALIHFNPRDAESLFNRGNQLLAAGRAEQALRDFDAALAVAPGEPALREARERALAQLPAR
jgi:tetratricopeptide (TPR) repeat protein